jgi:hypothetical protein
MKKALLTFGFSLMLFTVFAQVYNNEWIDYNKTYYKFRLAGREGLVRIPQSTLNSVGLGTTPAEYFQLWRNGQQVALYTSVATGPLGTGGYIEFWGVPNDGKPDKEVYINPAYQLSDKISLFSDSSSYFLTVNPAGGNLRYHNVTNNVAGNTLSPEPYFIYTYAQYPRTHVNGGFAAVVGEYVFSSSFDKGEWWSSFEFGPDVTQNHLSDTLFVNATGPSATYRIGVAGTTFTVRNVIAKINGTEVIKAQVDYFNDAILQKNNIPLSLLTGNSQALFEFMSDFPSPNSDRTAYNFLELTYPRNFNFGGARNFRFELQGTNVAKYIEISNFNYDGTPPVLYDLQNGERFIGDISDPSKVKFALPASASSTRKLVLASYGATNVRSIQTLTQRNFINYSNVASQGDYYIITHPTLIGGTQDPIADYQQYRSSVAGGSYNVKVVDINELYDQFAFGIAYHPSSIRNFTRFCRNIMSIKPKFFFLIGKGVVYNEYRYDYRDTLSGSYKINLVPTWGSPASDNLLCTDPGEYYAKTPIGRLSVVSKAEIYHYLNKVKEYELVLPNAAQTIDGKAWMKNVVHCVGGGDPYTSQLLTGYMAGFEAIIEDTLYGANVHTFIKSTAASVEQITNQELNRLFSEGIGILTYFGHSSANTFEFNLNDPDGYNNQGKYPVFIVNGCNSGNLFIYDTLRTTSNLSLSERYVLADHRGSIAFFASTHWGLPFYLNIITKQLYTNISSTDYGGPLGEVLWKSTYGMLTAAGPSDYFARQHAEQSTLHGDPAIRLYAHAKPDYTIEDPLLKISPSFISVAETSFTVNAKFLNIGKATSDSLSLDIKRILPNGTIVPIMKKKVTGIRWADSLVVNIPINPLTDKGLNKIVATVDIDNEVVEISETNNSVTKDIYIYEDEARPVYPYPYAIVANNQQKLYFSTANPLSISKTYLVEIDTTELFNSSLKVTKTIVSAGGISEVTTGLVYLDSTVYYWRVAPQPTTGLPVWNVSSFIYLAGSTTGFNQSHLYQFKHNKFLDKEVSQSEGFQYSQVNKTIKIRTGLVTFFDFDRIDVWIDDEVQDIYTLGGNHWKIMAFDPVTIKPIINDYPHKFNSFYYPGFDGLKSFEYDVQELGFTGPYLGQNARRHMMNALLDSIPDGYYVYITFMGWDNNTTFIDTWKADSSAPGFGPGHTLYHAFKQLGLNTIDTFTRNLPCIFFFKKNDPSYPAQQIWGDQPFTYLQRNFQVVGRKDAGVMESAWMGPARQWKEFHWRAKPLEPNGNDSLWMHIYGRKLDGTIDSLTTVYNATDTSMSWINAATYPYLKMVFQSNDYVKATPPQLRYWRLNGDFVPEGAVAPNIYFSGKDTLETGEPYNFGVAFKNISDNAFDSVKVKLVITDKNNVEHQVVLPKTRPIPPGDTVQFKYTVNTTDLTGINSIYVNFNPDYAQPEQFLYNNFLYKNFGVVADTYNPLLDVTFDGVHILDRDVVSSTPHIHVKLNDNSKYLALNDTALVTLKLRSITYGWTKNLNFSNIDTVRFTPANLAAGENSATVDIYPYFADDGDYELIVTGKDRMGNKAGNLEYRVQFKVINKPMISEIFNYPNPFTTSTAFVFTLTGREVPQQLKIEIMTITGKIVREITQDQLGPIHIGRNITEFKWDGTDMFGNKLANGVYLYRVVTHLNGASLDKYTPDDVDKNPSQYFKSGYGKMYLMR